MSGVCRLPTTQWVGWALAQQLCLGLPVVGRGPPYGAALRHSVLRPRLCRVFAGYRQPNG
jgi:hypothetical protein